jgi:hypothetical protein
MKNQRHMTIDRLIRQIKENENYWCGLAITPQQIEALAHLTDDEYSKLASVLLQEAVEDNEGLRGQEYRKTYAHLVYGTFLFCLRPNKDFYQEILTGALGIADPTSIKYGANALRLLKPVNQIVFDLFRVAEQNQHDVRILRHIAWLFYWLGFSDEGWRKEMAILTADDGWIRLYIESAAAESDLQEIDKVKTPANTACTRLVGVCAFSGSLCGLRWVPPK